MRLNVYVPDALAELVAERHPRHNASRLHQEALRRLAECPHRALECALCGAQLLRREVAEAAVDGLFGAQVTALEDLLWRGGTVEGSLRVLFDVARRRGVPLSFSRIVPRLTRAERERQSEAREEAS